MNDRSLAILSSSAWAEIDLSAIAHNIRELQGVTSSDVRFMAVVKANGYGHGAIEVARIALENNADWLGVARIEEAIELRNAGITQVPILVFGYTPSPLAAKLLELNITQAVSCLEAARSLADAVSGSQGKIRFHIKVDTGMGRLGMCPDSLRTQPGHGYENAQIISEIKTIMGIKNVIVEGIFTHFAAADSSDKSFTRKQLERFLNLLHDLKREGIVLPIRHAANSGGIIDIPDSHLDMVRAGISIYGLYPSDEVDRENVKLIPAMTLKARIIHIKEVPEGFPISYGMTYRTPKPTRIATVSIGYADGLRRMLSSRGFMQVCGKRAPIVGRVCMDLTMLDIGHIQDAHVGDEVIVFGKPADNNITADEIAARLNTINYEVVTNITQRVERYYFNPTR